VKSVVKGKDRIPLFFRFDRGSNRRIGSCDLYAVKLHDHVLITLPTRFVIILRFQTRTVIANPRVILHRVFLQRQLFYSVSIFCSLSLSFFLSLSLPPSFSLSRNYLAESGLSSSSFFSFLKEEDVHCLVYRSSMERIGCASTFVLL